VLLAMVVLEICDVTQLLLLIQVLKLLAAMLLQLAMLGLTLDLLMLVIQLVVQLLTKVLEIQVLHFSQIIFQLLLFRQMTQQKIQDRL